MRATAKRESTVPLSAYVYAPRLNISDRPPPIVSRIGKRNDSKHFLSGEGGGRQGTVVFFLDRKFRNVVYVKRRLFFFVFSTTVDRSKQRTRGCWTLVDDRNIELPPIFSFVFVSYLQPGRRHDSRGSRTSKMIFYRYIFGVAKPLRLSRKYRKYLVLFVSTTNLLTTAAKTRNNIFGRTSNTHITSLRFLRQIRVFVVTRPRPVVSTLSPRRVVFPQTILPSSIAARLLIYLSVGN